MKFNKLAAVALLSATVSMPALAAEANPPKLNDAHLTSEEFVKKATIGNNFEVATSKLALQNSKNPDIQKFAQHMVDDHGKVGEDFKPVVAKAGMTAAVPKEMLDTPHKAELDGLKNTTAATFDSKYIAVQKMAHKEAIGVFQDYADNGSNADLKDFASKTLPNLKEHQKELEDNFKNK